VTFERWAAFGPGQPRREEFRQAFHGAEFLLLQGMGCLGPWTLTHPHPEEGLVKLVVYVPEAATEEVRQAVAAAGGGHLGLYSEAAFVVRGEGLFRPGPGAEPHLGAVGDLARVAEVRLETAVAKTLVPSVVEAMLAHHPYEEVAYDLIPLANQQMLRGHGRQVRQRQVRTAAELVRALAAMGIAAEARGDGAAERIWIDLIEPLGRAADTLTVALGGDPVIRLEEDSYLAWEAGRIAELESRLGVSRA
jgi:hypothetical protein